jgi:hypothetical protein
MLMALLVARVTQRVTCARCTCARYFIRCTNLFSKLALGRNQKALGFLLNNPRFCFSYEGIFAVLKSDSIPALVRARFMTLMLRLFIDRDPQTSRPQVLYTRTWSKVRAEVSDLDMSGGASEPPKNPVCTAEQIKQLEAFLLQALPKLGGAVDNTGKPSISHATYGELEQVMQGGGLHFISLGT